MFKILALIALLQLASASTSLRNPEMTSRRHLPEAKIAGYEPRFDVSDHSKIDLDQADVEQLLREGDFQSAIEIYYQGAYSKPMATLHVPSILEPIPKGTSLKVVDDNGKEYPGVSVTDVEVGDLIVEFQYTSETSPCYTGGLQDNRKRTEGCLPQFDYLQIAFQNEITYSYNPTLENHNGRNFAEFSTGARSMHDCGDSCPYVTYEKFVDYYGHFQYGHVFVAAAYEDTSTKPLQHGNMNFKGYSDEARAEIIKKGAVYLNLWMFVIGKLEHALDSCEATCDTCPTDDSIHNWDEAVAFYTGSLEQSDDSSDGILLHALADKRCENFRTCGEDANKVKGTSKVNIEVFRHLKAGQNDLRDRNCASARRQKEMVEGFMAVPLVQGTLRYAWINDYEEATSSDKEHAEGAIFAASVLPLVHACNPDDAEFIYENMRASPARTRPDFKGIKRAFERNYECMGITCASVGGLYDENDQNYLQHASPCGVSSSNQTAVIVGSVMVGVSAALLVFVLWLKCCRKSKKDNINESFVGSEHMIGNREMS